MFVLASACVVMSGKHSFKLAHLSQQVAALTALLVKNGIQVRAAVKRPKGAGKSVKVQSRVAKIWDPVGQEQSITDQTSSSSSNWTTVKSSVTKESAKQTSDSLQSEGWNVPVVSVSAPEDVTACTIGVALVSMAVGKSLVSHGVRVDVSLGLLLPAPVLGQEEKGQLMSVVVQDKLGKLQVRQRYLYQLGPEIVVLKSVASKVEVVNDIAKAVMVVDRRRVSEEARRAVQSRAIPAARTWMRNRAGVSVLDVHPPTRFNDNTDSVRMVVQLGSLQDQQNLLAASGLDGISTNLFLTEPSDRERFKIVPLPFGVSFQEAREKALFLCDLGCGAVPCGICPAGLRQCWRPVAADSLGTHTLSLPACECSKCCRTRTASVTGRCGHTNVPRSV